MGESVGAAFAGILGGPTFGVGFAKNRGLLDGPDGPGLPDDREEDEAAAEAKRREQDRLRRGAASDQTRISGSVSQALSGTIGKRTLGGAV